MVEFVSNDTNSLCLMTQIRPLTFEANKVIYLVDFSDICCISYVELDLLTVLLASNSVNKQLHLLYNSMKQYIYYTIA